MTNPETHTHSRPEDRRVKWFLAGGITILALATVFVVLMVQNGWLRPGFTSERVRDAVLTSLEREAEASFLVTGTLDISTTTTVRNTKIFLPDILNFDLGTTEATVRMPGRVHYGFDVRELTEEHIRVEKDGMVRVQIPPLEVYAVEPDLASTEIQTSVGWARLYRSSGRRVEQRAVELANDALRRQAEQHLADSIQPEINAARAIERMIVPALSAAGMEEPRVQFQITPDLVLQAEEVRPE